MLVNSAIITPVLAAGSTTSPYYYQVNISQRLCQASCASLAPVFNPSFSVQGISQVGTGQYMATILVQGTIAYAPCNGNSCCTKTQLVSQSFSLPIASAAAPTSVTLTVGTSVNTIATNACQTCSRQFVSEVPLTVTVSTTA